MGCSVSEGFDESETKIVDENGDVEVHLLPAMVPYKMIQYLIRRYGQDLITELRMRGN